MSDTKNKDQILADFGEDFGQLIQVEIAQLFTDIHASVSPVDPISKQMAIEPT
jgi:hypothetical protein